MYPTIEVKNKKVDAMKSYLMCHFDKINDIKHTMILFHQKYPKINWLYSHSELSNFSESFIIYTKFNLIGYDNENVIIWTSSFLCHFCAFLFLINSSEIRGLIKFQMIFLSICLKIYLDIAIKLQALESIKLNIEDDLFQNNHPNFLYNILEIFLKLII